MYPVKLQAVCKCGNAINLECNDSFALNDVLKRYDAWQNQHAQCRQQPAPAWRPEAIQALLEMDGKTK